MKKLFVFDLDGTLAESKSSLSPEMAGLLRDLLRVMKVAVISGGSWAQFETQLLAELAGAGDLEDLWLLPTCGTQLYRYDHQWSQVYSEDLSDQQRAVIISSLQRAVEESGVTVPKVWGEIIEDRGSQITLSMLGQDAPLRAKQDWDPDFAKRKKVAAVLAPLLTDFAVHLGGTTSLDVTQPGIDKAYGIAKLRDHLGVSLGEMLFAGDAIFEGGNDYPVQEAGVDSIMVRDPHETARVIQTVIACQGDAARQVRAPARAS